MRVLFLDCFSGISGDMTVGALCDLGVKPSAFEWELAKLDIGDFHMHFERQQRKSIEGVKFGIHAGSTHTHDQDEDPDEHGQVHAHAHEHSYDHDHGHEHEHGDEPAHAHAHRDHGHAHAHEHEHGHTHEHAHDCAHDHSHGHAHEHSHEQGHTHEHGHGHSHDHGDHPHGRSYVEIRAMLEGSDLSDFVKKHALSIFHRVAVAEARIHGATVESIGFHEVGALDSIADIVLACVGLEELGVERVYVGKLADGHGWVDCAHGRFPIPAPATLEILRGIPVAQIDEPYEFITPTGAAIAAEFAHGFGVMPPMTIEKIGYGLGSRQLEKRPNVLRAVLGELVEDENAAAPAASGGFATDTITQIETNIDDLSPEIVGATIDRLLAAGALDAFFTPAQMKKNRPGVLLTVLCESSKVDALSALIFRHTSSFGLRLSEKRRLKLERRFETVQTVHGEIRVKLGFDAAGNLLQVSPEFESCRAVAERADVPLSGVYAAAVQAHSARS